MVKNCGGVVLVFADCRMLKIFLESLVRKRLIVAEMNQFYFGCQVLFLSAGHKK